MFDNLVESSSHKQDITRKGSFVIGTLIIYGVLIVAFAIASILWYDAHLSEQELELTTLVAPVPVPQQQKEPEQKQEAKPTKVEQNVDVRKELIADVAESRVAPKEISAKASDVPPVRRGVTTVIGSSDSNASAPMPAGSRVCIFSRTSTSSCSEAGMFCENAKSSTMAFRSRRR